MEWIGQTQAALQLIHDIFHLDLKGDALCKKCGRWLDSAEDFPADKSRPSGRYPICKCCKAMYQAKVWANTHPAKKAEVRKRNIERSKTLSKKQKQKEREEHNRHYRIKSAVSAVYSGSKRLYDHINMDEEAAIKWRKGEVIKRSDPVDNDHT